MNRTINLNRDIAIGIFFFTGVLGFMCGEFVISTTLFLLASLISNINFGEESYQS